MAASVLEVLLVELTSLTTPLTDVVASTPLIVLLAFNTPPPVKPLAPVTERLQFVASVAVSALPVMLLLVKATVPVAFGKLKLRLAVDALNLNCA